MTLNNLEFYRPKFACRKCGRHISVLEWRRDEPCPICKGGARAKF